MQRSVPSQAPGVVALAALEGPTNVASRATTDIMSDPVDVVAYNVGNQDKVASMGYGRPPARGWGAP